MRRSIADLAAGQLASHESLVDAVRELNLAAGTTLLEAADLDEVTTAVAELARVLRKESAERVVRAGFLEPRARAVAGRSIELNQLNPGLLDLDVTFGHEALGADGVADAVRDGDPTGLTAEATVTVNGLHEGPTDSVHGGVISFLMDCLLGVLVQATGIPSVTGTLDLRYLSRTPLDEPVVLRGRIVRHEGRKVFAEGHIEHAGRRTVEAAGLFIAVADRRPVEADG